MCRVNQSTAACLGAKWVATTPPSRTATKSHRGGCSADHGRGDVHRICRRGDGARFRCSLWLLIYALGNKGYAEKSSSTAIFLPRAGPERLQGRDSVRGDPLQAISRSWLPVRRDLLGDSQLDPSARAAGPGRWSSKASGQRAVRRAARDARARRSHEYPGTSGLCNRKNANPSPTSCEAHNEA